MDINEDREICSNQGRIQGVGAHPARASPPKIGKKYVFLA